MRIRKLLLLFIACIASAGAFAKDTFPDGTDIPEWFSDNKPVNIKLLGRQYVITDYGVSRDSNLIQTKAIQKVIDTAKENGGGVIIVPSGTFHTGALFFYEGTHLHVMEGGKIKGSNDICDFPILDTRFEGQQVKFFAALINADKANGFTISGEGTIDGNGLEYWKHFWLRREMNPQCTNMDEMRPRLVYVSNSNDVQIENVRLQNSPVWTTHLYKCKRVKLLNLKITSPGAPVKAPSTDAVDIDVCSDVLIKGCYMSVNDDAVALKGGKGPWADKDPNNGENTNIIIEDCEYGFCHSALTCGSESIHNRNIILRRIKISDADRLLWLKMRPDTPQLYEYITVENISGDVKNILYIRPWTQFFDLKGREDMPKSYGRNVKMKNIKLNCEVFLNVKNEPSQYELEKFSFENIDIVAARTEYDASLIKESTWKKIKITAK